MDRKNIKTLFLDIGGVLLSDGWDRYSRNAATKKFKLDPEDFSNRHRIFFEVYESGKISLEDYINHVVFYIPRTFAPADFMNFMFQQTKPMKHSIDYFMAIKKKYKMNIFALSNEGRELNEYRIKTFNLDKLFNGFISSCYVHLRKPDKDIFKIACDISFTEPRQALFVDDRIIHVQTAQSLGINAFQFNDLRSTKKVMSSYGFIV